MNKNEKAKIRQSHVLPVFRFSRISRGQKIYLGISHHKGEFIELFIKFPIERLAENEYMEADWDLFSRVVSVSGLSAEELMKHAGRSSRHDDDLPGIVLDVMQQFTSKGERQ